jgi:hypothetical protein
MTITTIDQNFYNPDWADEFQYGEREDYDIVYSDDLGDQPASYLDISDFDQAADEENDIQMDSHDSTETPNTISIISQKIRFANNGSMVVDVTINVEDVSGGTQYDCRVTKTS